MNKSSSKPITAVMSTKRVEALTDGVFAIAMTLLVLNIELPVIPEGATSKMLPKLVLGLWPAFFNYALSFFLLAVFWIVHHRQFHFIKAIDQKLLWINILGLMLIALIPFSTSLIAEYGDVQIAAIFFECNLLGIGLIFYMNWRYATSKRHLIDSDLSAQMILSRKKRYLTVPFVSLVAIGLSFLTPDWSELAYLTIPFILARHQRRQDTLIKEQKKKGEVN
ncbi:hypothetical protein LCGC14_1098650 [marine sediment metagenome]|uniref:DUF1211 domain-containing protein n=1 Tax=marine sediment metagenome TaxID=412755 RepID=A0A0F9MEN4_9ZZZZ